MAAHRTSTLSPTDGTVPAVDTDAVRAHIATAALRPSTTGTVGLELEFHVVDPATPLRRPSWDEVTRVLDAAGRPPRGSRVTVEPGGQVELSGPPTPDVGTAVAALQVDELALRRAAAGEGLAIAPIGADPARRLHRITPTAPLCVDGGALRTRSVVVCLDGR